MIQARIHLPLGPGPDRLAALENLLNVQAEANAVWLSEHPDAPCCPACAGVRYFDPPVGQCQNFWSAPDVLRRGKASCADAAAYEAGVKLAEGHQASVVLEDIDGTSMHAVVYVNGERLDPSAELQGSPNRTQPRCDRPGTVAGLLDGRGAMAVGSYMVGERIETFRGSAMARMNPRGQRFAVAQRSRRRPRRPTTRPAPPRIGSPYETRAAGLIECYGRCGELFSPGSKAWEDCVGVCSIYRSAEPPGTGTASLFFQGRRVTKSARSAIVRARRYLRSRGEN